MATKTRTSKPEDTFQRSPLVSKSIIPLTSAQRWYTYASLIFLSLTTVLWSLLGAAAHRSNADQLVNPFMFENGNVLRNALFPGQHSYFLKWPFFWLIHLFQESSGAYAAVTLILSLLTVLGFAYILHRIEKRPAYFATLITALSLVLLLIPAQPYPGGLLPVSMAMVATRNIEYIIFIGALYLIVLAGRLKNVRFVLAVIFLALLISSDKLFLSISAAGAIFMLLGYAFLQRWQFVNIALRWLTATGIAAIGALLFLKALAVFHVTHIIGSGNNPYGVISNPANIVHGLAFGFLSVLTNFGANPAFDTIKPKEMFTNSLHHIFSLGGLALVCNFLLLILICTTAWQLIKMSLAPSKKNQKKLDHHQLVALMALSSGLAALGAYLATNHYYPVDARYIALLFFAGFLSLAVGMRHLRLNLRRLPYVNLVLVGAALMATPMMLRTYRAQHKAVQPFTERNSLVAQALKNHPVNTLVGDYWRVIPIKQASGGNISVTPLEDCTSPRSVLNSLSWQPDLHKSSFAYLLSLDKGLTDFPRCSLEGTLSTFGRPNLSVVVKGSLEKPTEMLLFYDHGIHKPANTPADISAINAVTIPISTSELTNTTCSVPTLMNIVAHQDDDLIFMNPDLMNAVSAGHCVRTVYITAGDAGSGQFYWLGREQGSEAAYNTMLGTDAIWIQKTIKLNDNAYATFANQKGNNKVTLIFLHLPDGNTGGQGFRSSNFESLQKLHNRQIPDITSVYGNSAFTSESLTSSIAQLMHLYQPSEIKTQSTSSDPAVPDHSDHITVARFVNEAYARYEATQYDNQVIIPLTHYIGYPVHNHAANVEAEAYEKKLSVFLNYAKYDGSVCQTAEECSHNQAYGSYLPKQYRSEH